MKKLLKKLNISSVLTDAIASIQYSSSTKSSSFDTVLFFLLPLAGSILLVNQRIYLNSEFKGLLINAYAIFAGLLFGLQVFIFDIVSRVRELKITAQAAKLKILKIKYLSNNVSFEILICLFGALVLLISSIFSSPSKVANQIFSAASFYFFILFILLLILILKAVHVLLSEEISYQEKKIDEVL